jgi:hypothetical protein
MITKKALYADHVVYELLAWVVFGLFYVFFVAFVFVIIPGVV